MRLPAARDVRSLPLFLTLSFLLTACSSGNSPTPPPELGSDSGCVEGPGNTCNPPVIVNDASIPPEASPSSTSDSGASSVPSDSSEGGTTSPDASTLPPTPTTPVTPHHADDIAQTASSFLSGPSATQAGARPDAFDARRMAIVRGRVVTREGAPLES